MYTDIIPELLHIETCNNLDNEIKLARYLLLKRINKRKKRDNIGDEYHQIPMDFEGIQEIKKTMSIDENDFITKRLTEDWSSKTEIELLKLIERLIVSNERLKGNIVEKTEIKNNFDYLKELTLEQQMLLEQIRLKNV